MNVPKAILNKSTAYFARQQVPPLPTSGPEWFTVTKPSFLAYLEVNGLELVGLNSFVKIDGTHGSPEPKAEPVKTKVVFEPRSTAVGPRGGDPVKRLRTILATELSGAEWGTEHREAWKSLEGWTLADLAAELGIKA
jgi:hypothetical protein